MISKRLELRAMDGGQLTIADIYTIILNQSMTPRIPPILIYRCRKTQIKRTNESLSRRLYAAKTVAINIAIRQHRLLRLLSSPLALPLMYIKTC